MKLRILQTTIVLLAIAAAFLLSSCASKTPPEFLQNASAGMFGGVVAVQGAVPGTRSMMMVPAPQKPSGFSSFYNGGGQ